MDQTELTRRQKFHNELLLIMGTGRVHYEPLPSVQLTYPCIIYKRQSIKTFSANDNIYNATRGYQVTLIDRKADSQYIDSILRRFSMVKHNNHYVSDNLHHDIFTIYY